MKELRLTQGKVALVDDADFEILVSNGKWQAIEKKPGQFYASKSIFVTKHRKHHIAMHRFLLGVTDKSIQVDHINGDGLDNRRENLRLCTQTQNNANNRIGIRNKSGFKGVSWFKPVSKWRATIVFNKKQTSLGYFTDPKEAAKAYNAAAEVAFGEFARINNL